MAFGQAAGPPAGMRQIDELASLLERAGFTSFREARHPYGLTQRQAAGKFTAPEAAELIDRLTAAEVVQQSAEPEPESDGEPEPARVPARERRPSTPRATGRRTVQLSALGDDVLAAELERRGWCCIPPLQDPPIDPG